MPHNVNIDIMVDKASDLVDLTSHHFRLMSEHIVKSKDNSWIDRRLMLKKVFLYILCMKAGMNFLNRENTVYKAS